MILVDEHAMRILCCVRRHGLMLKDDDDRTGEVGEHTVINPENLCRQDCRVEGQGLIVTETRTKPEFIN